MAEQKITFLFDTSNFEASHGKAPKGRGYWGFAAEGHEVWYAGTYTEAKYDAERQLRNLAPANYKEVVVVDVLT